MKKKQLCNYGIFAIFFIVTLDIGVCGAEIPLRASSGYYTQCENAKAGRNSGTSYSGHTDESNLSAASYRPVARNVTIEKFQLFLESVNKNSPLFDKNRFSEIAYLYRKWGTHYGLRWDYAFFQMLLETNYLQFTGGVRKEDNNFAGIGATIPGEPGAIYNTVEEGVIAHFQHLGNYALKRISDQDFVTEHPSSPTGHHECDKFRYRCKCIRKKGSYSLCVRNWIFESVCNEYGKPATWEFLSKKFAVSSIDSELGYFDKIESQRRRFRRFLELGGQDD